MGAETATVTFLFVDLVGSTDLLHRLGDDANDDVTRRYQATMREVVDRHGGEVVRTMGDGLVVVFEHSVAEAVAAAIDMHRAIDRLGRADPLLRLQIRVGLSVGEASRFDGDWSGTPIFEAARLEAKARPGTILVNDVIRVLLGNRGGFEFTPVGALELKGFPEPLDACEVTWEPDPGLPEVPLPSALEVGLAWPLVGRDRELGELVAAWRSVVEAGRGTALRIGGDPGAGKTRLVAELAHQVQAGSRMPGGTVLYGRADLGTGLPLEPLAEALRWWAASVPPEALRRVLGDRFGSLSVLVPSLTARLPELRKSLSATDPAALTDAVVGVLADAASTGPLLLIVDGGHAMDEATVAAVAALAALDRPVLVLVCSRAGASDLLLDGLPPDAVSDLLERVVGQSGVDTLPEEVIRGARMETRGNPRLLIEAGERLVASGALGLADRTARDTAVRRALSGACPYRGLLPFQPDDADDFFGRDDVVANLLGRVAASRLLAVVGASGSGKSSLVRAGLVPALRRGALAESSEWPIALFDAGPRPLLELAAAVARIVERPVGDVLEGLEAGVDGLDVVLREWADRSSRSTGRAVIVVDQFEEVFTACRDEAERDRFAETLFHAAGIPGGRAIVVIALRGDFYGRCGDLPGLGGAIESSNVLLGPMDEPALRSVIEGPARRADLTLEPGLADVMIREVAGEPGGLPLLSHALYETWARRDGRTLTLAGYRDAGGARGAIARTAEAVYADQLDHVQQQLARVLFLALTELGEGTEDTRRRVPRQDLVERAGSAGALDDLVEVMVSARLVTVSDRSIEVAHEAVIREWPRLRDWLDEDRDTLRVVRHLAVAAREWDMGGRSADDLYRGPRLAAALEAAATTSPTDEERSYLAASQHAEEQRHRDQARQNRRLRRLLVGVGVLLVCAVVAGAVAFQQRTNANERTADADFVRLTTQALDLSVSNPSLAFLLALEANQARDNPVSRSALFSTLQRNRDFLGYTPTHRVATGSTLVGGDILAYGADDATVGFVDLVDGHQVTEPVGLGRAPTEPVTVFLADDRTRGPRDPVVAARADSGEVFLVDPREPQSTDAVIENGQAVLALAASSRLGLVAVGSEDGSVSVHRLATGDLVAELPAPVDPTVVEAPSPAAGAVAAYGAGGAVIDDGDAIALAFSPTRRELAVLRPGAVVELWSVEGGDRPVASSSAEAALYQPAFGVLAYRPDGAEVFAFDYSVDRALRVVRSPSAEVAWSVVSYSGSVQASYSVDGDEVLVADQAGEVTALDPDRGEARRPIVTSGLGSLAGLALTDDGRVVLTSGSTPVLGVWSQDGSGPVVRSYGPSASFPQGVGPDGETVLIAQASVEGPSFSIWDPRTGQLVDGDVPIVGGVYADDRLLAAYFADLTAGLYDIDRRRRVPPQFDLTSVGATEAVANADAGLLALGHEDGTVEFFDRTGASPYPTLRVDGVAQVQAISDDGGQVLVTSSIGSGAVYDTRTGQAVTGPLSGVVAAEFASGGAGLFVATEDSRIQELSLPELEPVGEPFPPLPSIAQDLSVSDDGRTLAATDFSRQALVFDAGARTQIGDDVPLASGDLDPSLFTRSHLSADGSFLVAQGARQIETWDLEPEHWRRAACRLAGRNLTRQEWETYLPNAGSYQRTCPQWPAGG